ncbi:hypothetical protein ACFE04_020763 [Oxalis oulophora]
MATYIDISSDDDDGGFEIENRVNSNVSSARPSSNVRILPSWENSRGHAGQSSRVPISKSTHETENRVNGNVSSARPSSNLRVLPSWENPRGHAGQSSKVPISKSTHVTGGTSSNAHSNDSKYFKGKGNLDQKKTVNSRIGNGYDSNNYERISSELAFKRTLPPSVQSRATGSRPYDSVGSSFPDPHKKNYFHPAGPSINNSKSHHYMSSTHDDVMMYERNGNGNRALPLTLTNGKSATSMHFPGPNDPMYRAGLNDERATESDERLIYQAALEDISQPKVEASLPDGLLSVSLLRHQKIALAWMMQKETKGYNCWGGILADDQGLGKTISTIALIQMQMPLQRSSKLSTVCDPENEALNLDDDDDSGGTNLVTVKNEVGNDGINLDKKKNEDGGNGGINLEKLKEEVGHNGINLEKGKNEESEDVQQKSKGSTSTKIRPSAGTLVVCPASVLRQWARELDEKVADENKLKVLIYHGGSRTKDDSQLAEYDVVLTTYAIVTNEVPKKTLNEDDEADEKNGEIHGLSSALSINKKRKKNNSNVSKKLKGKKIRRRPDGSSIDYDCGPLARVIWFRVVLDEAQTIKNHRTLVARACCGLRAKKRWCLSGTPIQNTIDDLYSYFKFLKYFPYADLKLFCYQLKLPISKNSVHGYKKLQAVLRAIMLRRTKETVIDGKPIINLPPKSIELNKVDFSAEERAFYTQLEADSRSQFKAYAAAGTLNQNYANILLMLLRLRQACDHPVLVKGYNSDSTSKSSMELAHRLPMEMVADLFSSLEASSALCCSCSDPPEEPVVTMCGHVFCFQCVSDLVNGDDNTCPASSGCKEQLGEDNIFSKTTLMRCLSGVADANLPNRENDSILQNDGYYSAKIAAVLEILQMDCIHNQSLEFEGPSTSDGGTSHEGPIKSIIFSQWTSMLDLLENSVIQHNIKYRRLDGKMSLASRDKAVKDFNSDPQITVMLMSLKAGNLGLNMVAANRVILLDLWWNPTTEDQAIDRAHRIGQTRPVTVLRLTVKDTVEDRILSLQEDKRKMVASAFGEEQSGGSGTRLTADDLKFLFMGI